MPPQREVEVVFFDEDSDAARRKERMAFLEKQEPYIRTLARVGSVKYPEGKAGRPKRAITSVVGSMEILLPVSEDLDLAVEETRLSKEIGKVEGDLARTEKKLENQDFLAKAKEEVIEKEKKKAEEFRDKLRTLGLSLKRMRELRES